jgi:hypothetical protein
MSKEKEGLFSKLVGLRTIKMGFEQTGELVKSLSAKDPNLYLKETFDEALERHGIPVEKRDAHLINIYKNLKLSFLMLLSMVILFSVIGAGKSFYTGNLLAGVAYSSLIFAFITVMANNSFRCYQIRNKELGGLSNWLRNYKEWYPMSLGKVWNK